jgi:hypothetical protein
MQRLANGECLKIDEDPARAHRQPRKLAEGARSGTASLSGGIGRTIMAALLGIGTVLAILVAVLIFALYVLRIGTLVACVAMIAPLIGAICVGLIVGGIALFAFIQIFGEPYYAGSVAAAGAIALAVAWWQVRGVLEAYRRMAGRVARAFGRKPERETEARALNDGERE